MKNALILHGTNASSHSNWFPWLHEQLTHRGWNVWVPDLPHADKPNIQRYNQFIFNNSTWQFTKETVLIGHSSGAVAILGLLQALPDDVVVDTCILVGAFSNDLGWESLQELFLTPFDFQKIKHHARHFIFIHSDNDPHCPLEQAEYLAKKTGGKVIIRPGEKHFSTDTGGAKFSQFPFLLELLGSQP